MPTISNLSVQALLNLTLTIFGRYFRQSSPFPLFFIITITTLDWIVRFSTKKEPEKRWNMIISKDRHVTPKNRSPYGTFLGTTFSPIFDYVKKMRYTQTWCKHATLHSHEIKDTMQIKIRTVSTLSDFQSRTQGTVVRFAITSGSRRTPRNPFKLVSSMLMSVYGVLLI